MRARVSFLALSAVVVGCGSPPEPFRCGTLPPESFFENPNGSDVVLRVTQRHEISIAGNRMFTVSRRYWRTMGGWRQVDCITEVILAEPEPGSDLPASRPRNSTSCLTLRDVPPEHAAIIERLVPSGDFLCEDKPDACAELGLDDSAGPRLAPPPTDVDPPGER